MKYLTVMLLVLFGSSASAASLIDFESASVGTVSNPFTIDGFTFGLSFEADGLETGVGNMAIVAESPGDNALKAAGALGPDPWGALCCLQLVMSSASGDPFALYGVDVVASALPPNTADLSIAGRTMGGGWATGPVGSNASWHNLEYVQFSIFAGGALVNWPASVELTLDNVQASVVPIPAAAWLFVSALAGLGWLRRLRVT